MRALTAEHLAARKRGIGGSDAPAVLGVSPWRTPLDVYLDKTDQSDPVETTEAMEWGSRLEDQIAAAAAERLGVRMRRRNRVIRENVEAGVPPEPTTLTDARRRWPSDHGGVAVATDGIREALTRLHTVRAEAKALADERAELELTLQTHMRDCAEITDPSGLTLATRKSQTTRRLDARALTAAHPELASRFRAETRPRVFRLKKEIAA